MTEPQTAGTRGARIELQEISHTYGSTEVLREVSLSIEAGEFVALLGPSGSGKTTTLNVIAGMVHPTRGRVRIAGKDTTGLSSRHHGLGIIFQNYALFPHMSAERNVMFPLRMRKVPKPEARKQARAALEMVRMGQYADRLPSQLSGGQQQRVAFARAVVFQPPALLLDEPLAALDRHLREELQLEIKRMHQELGMTFVCVTHDQGEAMTLADRIAIFNNGAIEQVGTPSELYERPHTTFVARFVGDSNLFPGTLIGGAAPVLRTEVGDLACAASAGVGDSGGQVSLLVRPERMMVHRQVDGIADGPRISAVVEAVSYQGAFSNVYLRSSVSGRRLIVREPLGARASIGPGEQVTVWWRPDDAVLVADSAMAAESVSA